MVSNFLKKHTRFCNCAGVFLLMILSFNVSAQLDSASVTLNFTNEVDPLDTNVMVDVLNVVTTVNDFNDLGEIVISVFLLNTDVEQVIRKLSKQDCINSGLVNGNTVTSKFLNLDANASYSIKTSLRRLDGANLPLIETSLIN